MQVRTKEMAADFDRTTDAEGEVVLIVRAGMLPRQCVLALGVLLEPVHARLDAERQT
jgi:hypothetical protein